MNLTIGITAYNESLSEVMKSLNSVENIPGTNLIVSVDDNHSLFLQIKKQYPELKVIVSETNIGLGRSRNKIINSCETPWLTFLDSGDCLNKDVVENFIEIQNTDIDLYIYQTTKHYRGKITETQKTILSKYRLLFENYHMEFTSSATAKIFNLSFIKQNQIFFPDKNLYHEDLLFSPKVYCNMKKYRVFNESLYNWYVENNTLSTSFSLKKLSDLTYIFSERRKFYKDIQDIIDFKTLKKKERKFVLNKIKISRNFHYLPNYLKFKYWDHV